ncbi:MAG: TlpA family protein disulfide reductase, partial [Rhodobacteraceae bacterium]|nr:TlpA family protein disulfide reductase [Paracoccaceae bacterium]
LADQRGKLVVLDLWATWCLPCRKIMPEMQRLHEKYADRKIIILGGNTYERADPAELINELGITYPQLLATDPLADALGIRGLPAVIVYGIDGKVSYMDNAGTDDSLAKLESFIEAYADEHGL